MTTLTNIDYTLMAGGSYISNRDAKNRFPVPQGWVSTKYDNPPNGNGFEVISFIHSGTSLATSTEIVISFAGTKADNRGQTTVSTSRFLQPIPSSYCPTQFSTRNPGTRSNSATLLVTNMSLLASACAAIHRSLLPMGLPMACKWWRIFP